MGQISSLSFKGDIDKTVYILPVCGSLTNRWLSVWDSAINETFEYHQYNRKCFLSDLRSNIILKLKCPCEGIVEKRKERKKDFDSEKQDFGRFHNVDDRLLLHRSKTGSWFLID